MIKAWRISWSRRSVLDIPDIQPDVVVIPSRRYENGVFAIYVVISNPKPQ